MPNVSSSNIKTLLLSDPVGDIFNAAGTVIEYKESRKQGNSKIKSVAKSLASFGWGEFYYNGLNKAVGKVTSKVLPSKIAGIASLPLSILATAGPAVVQGINAAGVYTTEYTGKSYTSKGKFGSGYFNMTEAGYTMRQRSINAIRSNGLNTQSVLGNEARTYYRGSV